MEHRRAATRVGRPDRRRARCAATCSTPGAVTPSCHWRWPRRATRVVGIELTPTAVAAATKAAQERELPNATFVQDDITSFTGFDGRFNTIIDSTLFHSLPVEGRDGYQQSVLPRGRAGRDVLHPGVREGRVPRRDRSRSPTRSTKTNCAPRSASTGRSTRSGPPSSTPTPSVRRRADPASAPRPRRKGQDQVAGVPVDGTQGLVS